MGQVSNTIILSIVSLSFSIVSCTSCKGEPTYVNDRCSISCVDKEFSSLSINVTCENSLSWDEFSAFRIPSDLPKDKSKGLIFNRCNFPDDFSLRNFTDTIGLGEINWLKIVSPGTSFKNVSKRFFRDMSIGRLEILEADTRYLPADFLKPLKDTWQLRILHSKVSKIKNRDLDALDDLLELDVTVNRISDVEPGSFDRLIHLHSLDLSFNNLFSLSDRTFKNLKKLTKIDLSHNRLLDLPSYLFRNEDLREINLNGNQLLSLRNRTFASLPSLLHLELKSNKLSQLPADLFVGSNALEKLFLDENSLTVIPSGIFRRTSLKYLGLSYNQLKFLQPGALYGLSSLEHLDLSNNQLEMIPGDLCHYIPNVVKIDLSKNKLTTLNRHFVQAVRPFTDISLFSECHHLEKLKLNDNKIFKMYHDWVYNANLRSVQLANNQITKLTADVLKMKQEINLQNNKISSVQLNLEKLVELVDSAYLEDLSISRPKSINLRGNSWDCSCKNIFFFNYVQNRMNPEVYQYVDIETDEHDRCVSPISLNGTLLSHLSLGDFICDAINKRDVDSEFVKIQLDLESVSHTDDHHIPIQSEIEGHITTESDIETTTINEDYKFLESYPIF